MTKRRRTLRRAPLLLAAPLILYLVFAFFLPVGAMLTRGMTEQEMPTLWPETAAQLKKWDGTGTPPDRLVQTMAREMIETRRGRTLNLVANRINYAIAGSRSLIFGTAQRIEDGAPANRATDFVAIDPRWGRRGTWAALRHASGPVTSFYLLAALDRRLDTTDTITPVPEDQRVFVNIFLRTFEISAIVTLLCALLGYPLACLLASLPQRAANPLLILVLLPFWTSTLARTTAWVVLLQTEGVINGALQSLGLTDAPLPLLYNRLSVYIAMTHVLLPFLILPLYGVMRSVPLATLRAARSLGAGPIVAFARVYFPQTLPGLIAGAAIVFTLSLGYYVTPALVGGGGDQMISASIAFYTNQSLNWGLAAALSLLLLLPLLLLWPVGRAMLTRERV